MHRNSWSVALALYILALLVVSTDALQTDSHLLTNLPEANDDVDTVHYFAGNAEGKMLSGRTLQVLLGFRNSGETPQTVSQITGSLNSPKHFSLYVSNFSTATYNLVVEPGKETSFEYLLKVDPQLAGHDFTLALTVFYQDASDRYSSTFINATIPVFDPDASFDTQTIFMYMSLISLAFAATYVVLQATGTLGGVKIFAKKIFWVTSGRGSRVQQPRGSFRSNDWLRGTAWATD